MATDILWRMQLQKNYNLWYIRDFSNGVDNGVYHVANDFSNGVANGVYHVANDLSNGVYHVANDLSNGVANGVYHVANDFSNGVANGVYHVVNDFSNGVDNGVYHVANDFSNGVYHVANDFSNGVANGGILMSEKTPKRKLQWRSVWTHTRGVLGSIFCGLPQPHVGKLRQLAAKYVSSFGSNYH